MIPLTIMFSDAYLAQCFVTWFCKDGAQAFYDVAAAEVGKYVTVEKVPGGIAVCEFGRVVDDDDLLDYDGEE
jgi:hypothetical protein